MARGRVFVSTLRVLFSRGPRVLPSNMHVLLVMCGALGFSHGGLNMDRCSGGHRYLVEFIFWAGSYLLFSFIFYMMLISVLCLVTQSCLTLCDPIDCSPQAPLSMGILQTRILQWVAISFSRGSSQPSDQTQVSLIAGRFFPSWITREAQCLFNLTQFFVWGEGFLVVLFVVLFFWLITMVYNSAALSRFTLVQPSPPPISMTFHHPKLKLCTLKNNSPLPLPSVPGYLCSAHLS